MLVRSVIERALDRARRAGITAASLDDIEQLEFALDQRPAWLTPGLASRIADVLKQPAPVIAPVGVGEALLLVCDGATRRGRTLRLRALPNASGSSCFGDRAQRQVRQAQRALLDAIYQRGRSWPSNVARAEGATVEGLSAHELVDEESLGLSVAVAELSRATQQTPRATIAASAIVDSKGTLRAVAFLPEKIAALRADWPAVDTLVVAEGTGEIADLPSGFTVIRARTLSDAIGYFGLSFDALPSSSTEHAELIESALERQSRRPHSPDEWSALADDATNASLVLAADGAQDRALRVRAWAALFRVHAGRSYEVDAAEVSHDPALYDPRVVAAMAVSQATAAIDATPETCVSIAQSTVERARACGDRAILARALGTLGRALTHAGAPARAEEHFRAAIALWSEVEQPQIAQTLCYLATSLRRAGRVDEAAAIAEEALARSARRESTAYANETARFAWLELGRCQFERRMLDEAEVSLGRVVRDAFGDGSYPNIGALATRCAVRLELGDDRGAQDDLARCARIAAGHDPIARTAMQAIGWRLLRPDPPEEHRALWTSRLAAERSMIERALREWVY